MKKDVSLQRSHEEQRRGARIADFQSARDYRPPEVVGDDGEAAAGWAVAFGIEGKNECGALCTGVHGHHDVRSDHGLGEGDELLGHAAEDDAGIGVRGSGGQVADAGGRLDHVAAVHGLGEEGVLGIDVAEEGGGGDVQFAGDVGEGGGGKALRGEETPGGGEDLIAVDARRATHL